MQVANMTNEEIVAGQVLIYKCRAGEEESRVTVFKVDSVSESSIIHIRIDSLKLTNKDTGEIVGEQIAHLPIDLKSFKESICELESLTAAFVTEGYWIWKKEFDAGNAGVWATEISEVINLIETSMC